MQLDSARARRLLSLPVVLALTALGLAGCGGDESRTPFQTPAGESAAVADLGFPVVATRNTTRTATDDPEVAAAAVARAIYSGSAAARAPAVTLVNQRDWRAALAATALMARPIGAPILFSDGNQLPKTTAEAVTALAPTGSEAAGNAQAIRVGNVGRPPGLRTTDIEGADAYELAFAIDRFTTAVRRKASARVLVVSAESPEFAVPAASWLAKTGDPVAFVTKAGIPPATARQLATHPKTTLYVLGPKSVIPGTITKALQAYGTVRRVGGEDPVSNAVGFARYADGSFGWNINEPGHGFTFARSNDTLGAISLAPLSTSGLHGPLLLLDAADQLSVPVREYLLDVQPGYANDPSQGRYNRGWLTGDIGAISANVQSQIDALLEIAPVQTTPETPSTTTAPTTTTSTTPTPSPEAATTTGPTPPAGSSGSGSASSGQKKKQRIP